MAERVKYLFKNMGILTISSFASKILVFLLVPLYTSILSTSEYGTYDLVVSTISLIYPILTMNIYDAVMRYCLDKNCSNDDIAVIASKKVLFSILFCGVALLVIGGFNLIPEIGGLKVYIFLYYVSYVINQFFVQFAKGLEKVSLMGIAGVISTLIMVGCNLLFLLVLKMGLPGFFIANILAQAVPTVFYFFNIKFWKYIKTFKSNKALEKQMLIYCLPLIFTTLGWWINNVADRYVVTFICGIAANGILSVAYKIPSIINVLQGIFIQAWQISAIKEYGESDTSSFYGKTFTVLNLFMSLACAVLILFTKPLAHILYSNEFFEAWKYVPFLMISTVLNCSSGFVGPILAAQKDSKSMAISSIYGSIVNIILNFILVYMIGIQGATIATVISSYLIYHFRLKAAKNEIVIFSYWKVLVSWGLLMCQAIIEIYFSIWSIEILLIAGIIAINIKEISEIMKKVFCLLKK